MLTEKINRIRNNVMKNRPLIHCITNPISINPCANVILSAGARAIMAEHPRETEEITYTADALMLNMGNITDARMESMMFSAKAAKKKGIPVVLDVVGVACSTLRREYVLELLSEATPSVIKGNYSEINALFCEDYKATGVDAELSLGADYITEVSAELADKYSAVVLATGKKDIITDGKRFFFVRNGTVQLTTVTGTGCMLGALCAAYLTAGKRLEAVTAASCVFGICGELSATEKGAGTFMKNLMDNISTINNTDINQYINVEAENEQV